MSEDSPDTQDLLSTLYSMTSAQWQPLWPELIKAIPDSEFTRFRFAMNDEQQRRDALPFVHEAENQITADYQAANPPATDSETGLPEWHQPAGAHDAWPGGAKAAMVVHDGQVWQNALPSPNVWEPGNDGPVPTWNLIATVADYIANQPDEPTDPTPPATGETIPDWVAGEAIKVGDKRRYSGNVYEAVQAHTTQAGWDPVTVPSLWKKV